MNVIRRGPDGKPREYELNDVEMVVHEIHDNLMDTGLSQGEALRLMMGGTVPSTLRQSPIMDRMDAEFLGTLAD